MNYFCKIPVNINSKEEFFKIIFDKNFSQIVTLNAQIITLANENSEYLKILNKSFNCIDGQVPFLIYKFLNDKIKHIEKISGSVVIYDLFKRAAEKKLKIFFLGSDISTNLNAVKFYDDISPGKSFGYSNDFENYPFSKKTSNIIRTKITESKPDIIIVAYGAPKQELWISDNTSYLKSIGVIAACGLGGSLDMLSNKKLKSPEIISKLGLESIYRIISDPLNINRYKRLIFSFKFFSYLSLK